MNPSSYISLPFDPRHRLWVRMLVAFQVLPGALRGNDPHASDTMRTTLVKLLCAIQGILWTTVRNVVQVATLLINNGELHWVFAGTDPDLWSIQQSPAGQNNWSEIDAVPGSDRSFNSSLDPASDFSIVPLIVGNPGTRSNIVSTP
jgi:hypothetical protein